MADYLPRPCTICRRVLVRGPGRCVACQTARGTVASRRPASAAARGYGRKWQSARAGFLRKHPFCVVCLSRRLEIRATEVDHIRPHRGDQALFWQRANWQPLCKRCHARKTLAETRAARPDRFRGSEPRRLTSARRGAVLTEEE